jgi:hypothetical protein
MQFLEGCKALTADENDVIKRKIEITEAK